MNEQEKLMQLLDGLHIDHKALGPAVTIDNMDVLLLAGSDGIQIFGAGYAGVWSYSADYCARLLDRLFREECIDGMENNS